MQHQSRFAISEKNMYIDNFGIRFEDGSSQRNIDIMFRATSTTKYKETITTTLMLIYCNMCRASYRWSVALLINYTLETTEKHEENLGISQTWGFVTLLGSKWWSISQSSRLNQRQVGPLRSGLKWTKACWAMASCKIEFLLAL